MGMTTQANPSHSAATLQKYAKRLYDAATRAFRALPTDDAAAVLRGAMSAMKAAHACHAGAAPQYAQYAAHELNAERDCLNALLVRRGQPALSYVKSESAS